MFFQVSEENSKFYKMHNISKNGITKLLRKSKILGNAQKFGKCIFKILNKIQIVV
jgi:hypothetical protein